MTPEKTRRWDGVEVRGCRCCDAPAIQFYGDQAETARCRKHVERNPCCVPGCTRTRTAKSRSLRTDLWFCSEHWRRFCPPHSRLRRTYLRFFRIAKRQKERVGGDFDGWDERLNGRFWRFWFRLVARARAACASEPFDMTEINKLFGWTSDE